MLLIYRLRENPKWSAAADQDGKQEANSDTIFSEIYVVKGVIDRSVSKLYTLATQGGDAILNPNGKTRVFQRNAT